MEISIEVKNFYNLGYSKSEISKHLNISIQEVENQLTQSVDLNHEKFQGEYYEIYEEDNVKHPNIYQKFKDFDNLNERDSRGCPENKKKLAKKIRNNIPKDIILYIYQRDNYKCSNCGSKDNLTIDHIKTINDYVKGYGLDYDRMISNGINSSKNLQILCRKCNGIKSYKSFYYQ